jgi:hypothetical protein
VNRGQALPETELDYQLVLSQLKLLHFYPFLKLSGAFSLPNGGDGGI